MQPQILLALILALTIICIPIQLVCNCLGCAPQPPPQGATATGGGADDATQAAGGLTQVRRRLMGALIHLQKRVRVCKEPGWCRVAGWQVATCSHTALVSYPPTDFPLQEEMMAEMAARNAEARKAAGRPPAQQAPMGA